MNVSTTSSKLTSFSAAALAILWGFSAGAEPPTRGTIEGSAESQSYRLGSEDLIEVKVFEAPELDRTVRVAEDGEITLPLLGSVLAAGRTAPELETHVEELLRSRQFVKEPNVTVFVREVLSRPISVLGAVARPGVLQVRGAKPLLEVLSMAGGLAEEAGETVIIDRAGSTGEHSRAIDLKELLESADPSTNLLVQPGDTVKVARAGIVYVVGDVHKPGGFVLKNNETMSVLQALAVAEGLTATASKKNSVIIRQGEGGERSEIPVDLERVLERRAADPYLEANDIVFVPTSGAKAAFLRGVDTVVRTLSGIAIYRR